jgi:hypothetical protein
MNKRALFAVAGFLGLCVSLSAQEMRDFGSVQPGIFTLSPLGLNSAVSTLSGRSQADLFGTLNSAWYGPAPMTLADGRLFSFPGAFAWTEATPADFLPAATLASPPRLAPVTTLTQDSSTNQAVNFQPDVDYAGGEVGFFYGGSTGKYSHTVKGGYILGEIVDGNTHISVGASYEHASGRVPILIGR